METCACMSVHVCYRERRERENGQWKALIFEGEKSVSGDDWFATSWSNGNDIYHLVNKFFNLTIADFKICILV